MAITSGAKSLPSQCCAKSGSPLLSGNVSSAQQPASTFRQPNRSDPPHSKATAATTMLVLRRFIDLKPCLGRPPRPTGILSIQKQISCILHISRCNPSFTKILDNEPWCLHDVSIRFVAFCAKLLDPATSNPCPNSVIALEQELRLPPMAVS